MDKADALAKVYARCRERVDLAYPGAERVLVFGEGDPDARVMLVGEAPGEKETLLRRPFVGKAGKNLEEFLEILRFSREQLYITNVVKFRPVKIHPRTGTLSNRPPDREEIGLFIPTLLEEIRTVSPAFLVTLGNTSLRAVTGDNRLTVGGCHGQPRKLETGGVSVTLFPLYHPASIIYNRSLAPVYRQDVAALGKFLQKM
ncbi:MAG: uracil-DNA glycosylase [Christensenellales bacterium]|jgi:uracil-DNA glycosylase family 4